MTVSKERSVNGSTQRNIDTIFYFTMRLASALPVQEALTLVARIGQWRSQATMRHRQERQARARRLQRKENRPHNPAESNSSASAFDPPRQKKTELVAGFRFKESQPMSTKAANCKMRHKCPRV
jgi:hypothetical protein